MTYGLTTIVMPIHNIDLPLCHYTGNAIGSIKSYTNQDITPYGLFVIDNDSPVELGGVKWDEVTNRYQKNKENWGYGKSMNHGIRTAQGEYVCLFSSDVQVFDFWLEDLLEALNHVDVVMSYPMYDKPYGRAFEAFLKRKEWMDEAPDQYLSEFRDFSCVVAKKETFLKAGLFDENFGLGYSEDLDLSYSLKEKGLTLKSNKRVNTHHIGMATGHSMMLAGEDDINGLMNKNKDYLSDKWNLDKPEVPKEKPVETTGKVIRTKGTGDKVYWIKDSEARWVKNPETLSELGFDFDNVNIMDHEEFSAYDRGEPIDLKSEYLAKQKKEEKEIIEEPVLEYREEA